MPRITISFDDHRPAVSLEVSGDNVGNIELLAKLAPGEPFWVLRAQDQLSSRAVRYWANEAEANDVPPGKVAKARVSAAAMRNWRPQRMPD